MGKALFILAVLAGWALLTFIVMICMFIMGGKKDREDFQ